MLTVLPVSHDRLNINERRDLYIQVQYLLSDCSEAQVKIKMAFRPGVVRCALLSCTQSFHAKS
jgi:hypothetical protein